MAFEFEIVDVFAERPLEGNQLAVVFVPDAGALTAHRMQAIAREMNFSETTFVLGGGVDPQVRIFTPGTELPFAGHPTLGTASVLRRRGATPDAAECTLQLRDRRVRVSFDDQGRCWFDAPPATQLGELPRGEVAARLRLDEAQLSFDAVTVWDIGPRFALVETADLHALTQAQADAQFFTWLGERFANSTGVLLFSSDAHGPDAHYAARMLFWANGVREDPATGSANACLANYLKNSGRDPGGVVIVEQGYEMNRPSKLYLSMSDGIRVGGHVHALATGTLNV